MEETSLFCSSDGGIKPFLLSLMEESSLFCLSDGGVQPFLLI
jgi:hypothetical protein